MALGRLGAFDVGGEWDKPSRVPKKKAVPKKAAPAKPSKSLTDDAKKWATEQAESILTEPELRKPEVAKPPPGSPYRPGKYVPSGPTVRQPTVDERFTMAAAATFSTQARQDLADTMSEQRRKELLRQAAARRRAIQATWNQPPPPSRSLWDRALDIGEDIGEAAVGRVLSVPGALGLAIRATDPVHPISNVERRTGQARALGEFGLAGTAKGAELAMRPVVSGVLDVLRARDALKKATSGEGGELSVLHPGREAKTLRQAGGIPVTAEDLKNVGYGGVKVLAAAPGAVAGIAANPIRAAQQAIEITRASGAGAVGLVPMMFSPGVTAEQRAKFFDE